MLSIPSPLKFPGAEIRNLLRPSRNFMGSIPKSLRRPNTYSSGRKPSDGLREAQDHRNTTFAGQQKTVKEARWSNSFCTESMRRKNKTGSRRGAKLTKEM